MCGTTHSFGARYADVYLIKIDRGGDTLWTRSYFDDLYHQRANCIRQTWDGAYIIVGEINYGETDEGSDMYVLKTDGDGTPIWSKAYSAPFANDIAYSVEPVADSGYVVIGRVTARHEAFDDIYLIRMDNDGTTLWTRSYGGAGADVGNCVRRTRDGGFMICGHTYVSDEQSVDLLLTKTNEIGTEIWSRTYGGPFYDYGYHVEETPDGGYVVAGDTYSFGAGLSDVFLFETDDQGKVIWVKTYGGPGTDGAREVRQTADGGFIVAGRTYSFGAGGYDTYILRLEATPDDLVWPELTLAIFHNPYMTQYLDIYLMSSEPLDSATVSLEVDGEEVGIQLLDSEEDLWRSDYKIESPTGVVSICGRAADIAHNDTSVTVEFSAALVRATDGGRVSSPDGRMAVRIDAGILMWDTYVSILPCGGADGAFSPPSTGRIAAGAAQHYRVLTPSGNTPAAYCVGPSGILAGEDAVIEFSYADYGVGFDIDPDQLYIEAEGVGPLESFVDIREQTVSAVTGKLGTFRLAVGRPGMGKMADASFLRVSGSSPNPFAAATQLRYEIRAEQWVRVAVYDACGRRVRYLLADTLLPGMHKVAWDGRTASGRPAASGVYLIRVETQHGCAARKVTLIQ
jgi:hypothetical protein